MSSGSTSIRFTCPTSYQSISSHCGMSHNQRPTLTSFGSFLPIPAIIICHQEAFRMTVYWDRYSRVAGKLWRGEGGAGVYVVVCDKAVIQIRPNIISGGGGSFLSAWCFTITEPRLILASIKIILWPGWTNIPPLFCMYCHAPIHFRLLFQRL